MVENTFGVGFGGPFRHGFQTGMVDTPPELDPDEKLKKDWLKEHRKQQKTEDRFLSNNDNRPQPKLKGLLDPSVFNNGLRESKTRCARV